MVINYERKHEELFEKIYIDGVATERDKQMYVKLCDWVSHDENNPKYKYEHKMEDCDE